ncbi:MAG: FKBP-type peptidyl-prolyl cis-trans isomerase [Hyphomonadaceae bacterium]
MLRGLAFVSLVFGLAACSSTGAGPAAPSAPAVVAAPVTIAPPTITRSAWFKYAPWNSSLSEVKKTSSGLEYIVLASGPASGIAPLPEQSAKIYYEGRLNSGGRAFDSAFDRGAPDVYELAILVPGFREALSMMRPGDRWMIYIPAAIGYAERGYPGLIGPGENLLFEILMVGVE